MAIFQLDEVETSDYSCIADPPIRDRPIVKFDDEVEFKESSRIEDLNKMLLHQPVTVNMILYEPDTTILLGKKQFILIHQYDSRVLSILINIW